MSLLKTLFLALLLVGASPLQGAEDPAPKEGDPAKVVPSVPEPHTALLAGLGGLVLLLVAMRRK